MKYWYFVVSTPVQNLPGFHHGEHPLTRSFYEKLQHDVATKLALLVGQQIPPRTVIISNVMEVSEEVYTSWKDEPDTIVT